MKMLRLSLVLWLPALSIIVLNGCVQSEQHYQLNQNGSGKVHIEATLTVNPKLSNKKEKTVSYEDSVKMYEKIEEIVLESEGIEAWDSLSFNIHKDGKLDFSGIAYFPDITKLDLKEVPIVPVIEFNENHIKWGNSPSDEVEEKLPDESSNTPDTLSTEEIIENLRDEFNQSKQVIKMAMSFFDLDATYHFPYKIKSADKVEKKGDRSIRFNLEGEQIMEGFEQLMEDDAKLKTLVEDKGVRKFDFNDPHILKAAYPDRSLMKVQFRSGFLSPSPKDAFDYEKAVEALNPKIPEIRMP